MERSLETALRDRLATYLADESTVDEFKAWLVATTWNPPREYPPTGIRLVNEVKLAFAEHSGGFSSDEELRANLVAMFNRIGVEALVRKQKTLTSTASGSISITTRSWSTLGSLFGEPRVVVSAS